LRTLASSAPTATWTPFCNSWSAKLYLIYRRKSKTEHSFQEGKLAVESENWQWEFTFRFS
jgi:hypothetical protein